MPNDIKEYVKEFGDYLLKRGKSKATIENYCIAVKQLLKHSDKTPKTLNLDDIMDFSYEIKRNNEPNTQKPKLCGIKRYLKYIKRVYKNTTYSDYEDDKDETDEDILKALPVIHKEIIPLTKKEVMKLFELSRKNPCDHAVLKLFYYSAQRISSIQNLNLNDIDWECKTDTDENRFYAIKIQAKGNRTYTIEINQD